MKTKSILLILSTIILCSFVIDNVQAQASTTPDPMQERLTFLQERLDASRAKGQWWQWSWGAVSVLGLGYNSISAVYEDSHEIRVGEYIESGKSLINIVYLIVDPMEAMHGSSKIPTQGTTEEKVKVAESLLQTNAQRAEERTDWTLYAANTALEGVGLGITLRWGRAKDAWINFAEDMIVGSLQIWSEPGQPKKDWQAYQEKFQGVHPQHVSWSISPVSNLKGLAFHVRW